MKVIFLQNVTNVAKAGDVKEVSDGYARNLLIPRKLALKATPDAMKVAMAQIKAKSKLMEEALKTASQLDGKAITLKAKAGEGGRLHGAITNADIAEEIRKATGLDIDKRKIELNEPIHGLGVYEINVKPSGEAVAKVTVTVEEDVEPSAG